MTPVCYTILGQCSVTPPANPIVPDAFARKTVKVPLMPTPSQDSRHVHMLIAA